MITVNYINECGMEMKGAELWGVERDVMIRLPFHCKCDSCKQKRMYKKQIEESIQKNRVVVESAIKQHPFFRVHSYCCSHCFLSHNPGFVVRSSQYSNCFILTVSDALLCVECKSILPLDDAYRKALHLTHELPSLCYQAEQGDGNAFGSLLVCSAFSDKKQALWKDRAIRSIIPSRSSFWSTLFSTLLARDSSDLAVNSELFAMFREESSFPFMFRRIVQQSCRGTDVLNRKGGAFHGPRSTGNAVRALPIPKRESCRGSFRSPVVSF